MRKKEIQQYEYKTDDRVGEKPGEKLERLRFLKNKF